MIDATIMIVGYTGMLGHELTQVCEVTGRRTILLAGPDDLDITDRAAVQEAINDSSAGVVINATGYTDVDGAETNAHAADAVNRLGVLHLAEACRDHGALLVHYSTDYVFNGEGDRPYPIDAPVSPQSVYGRTKLAGEKAIVESGADHLIIRTSWLFAPHGENFLLTILRLAHDRDDLKVVADQTGRPTAAGDLAKMTLALIDHEKRGVFHAANDGSCTWYEFASEIVKVAGLDCVVRPCKTEEFPRPAPRPRYSVLDLGQLMESIGPPRHWKEAVAETVRKAMDCPGG